MQSQPGTVSFNSWFKSRSLVVLLVDIVRPSSFIHVENNHHSELNSSPAPIQVLKNLVNPVSEPIDIVQVKNQPQLLLISVFWSGWRCPSSSFKCIYERQTIITFGIGRFWTENISQPSSRWLMYMPGKHRPWRSLCIYVNDIVPFPTARIEKNRHSSSMCSKKLLYLFCSIDFFSFTLVDNL